MASPCQRVSWEEFSSQHSKALMWSIVEKFSSAWDSPRYFVEHNNMKPMLMLIFFHSTPASDSTPSPKGKNFFFELEMSSTLFFFEEFLLEIFEEWNLLLHFCFFLLRCEMFSSNMSRITRKGIFFHFIFSVNASSCERKMSRGKLWFESGGVGAERR